MKVCVCCMRRLGPEDLLDRSTQLMERERASVGLEGVCFQCYSCPRCGHDHVFLEVFPLPDEARQDLQGRKEELARAVQGVHGVSALDTSVLVVERGG